MSTEQKEKIGAIRSCEQPRFIGYYTTTNHIGIVSALAQTLELSTSQRFTVSVENLAKEVALLNTCTVPEGLQQIWGEEVAITYECLELPTANCAVYRYHNGNRLAIVCCDQDIQGLEDDVYKLAVQCVAGAPKYLSRDQVPDIEQLMQTAVDEALAMGKPQAIAEKIAQGRISSQLKEIVFLEQTMYCEKISVRQYAERLGLAIKEFHLFN